jgi:hypothetical protein
MPDLKIPNFNMNTDKYIFKKKLSLRRKTSGRLITESTIMFISSLLLFYIIYLIPNKYLLLQKIPTNISNLIVLTKDQILNLKDIIFVIFIFISFILSLALMVGSLFRLYRIVTRKTRKKI